jgi:hypothetical protein
MIPTRRLALSVLCTASLATALVAASPAMALQAGPRSAPDCGMSSADVNGTFEGTFDNRPADTLSVTFSESGVVATAWTVEGWQGEGTGRFEFGSTGPQWTNSDLLSGVVRGNDSETYRSGSVTCAAGDSRATTITGVVVSGSAQIPFTVSRP